MIAIKEKIKRLPDSELEIMKIIWEANEPVNTAYICEQLKDKKDWKPTSVLTFLARLTEKGFIKSRREGKSNIYSALVKEQVYLETENQSFLGKLYGNSLTNFISALYSTNAINEEDLSELREFIDNLSRGV